MTDKEIKELLRETAEDIRRRPATKHDVVDVLLNLAAVVEHMDPDTLRSRKLHAPAENLVHGVVGGRAICGLLGPPSDWPAGHSWLPIVRPYQHVLAGVTCLACRLEMEKN